MIDQQTKIQKACLQYEKGDKVFRELHLQYFNGASVILCHKRAETSSDTPCSREWLLVVSAEFP